MSRRRSNDEGSIYRRASDGLWVAALTYADDNGKRRQRVVASGRRRGDVAEKLEEARRRLKADEPVKDARLTVAMFVADWIRKALPASGRKPATIENYATMARAHLTPPPFGALTLDRLRPSDVEALLTAKRAAGLSDSSVRLIYTVARAMLDIAVRDGLVRRNVAAAVKRPTVRRSEARYLTLEDVGLLLEAARGDRLEPLVVLMLGTGLRRGEALALHWADVDLAAEHVRVKWTLSRVDGALVFDEPKTDRSRRFVPLPSPVAETLKRHRAALAAERLAAPRLGTLGGTSRLGVPDAYRHAYRPQECAQGIREDRRPRGAGRCWFAHASAFGVGVDCLRCSS